MVLPAILALLLLAILALVCNWRRLSLAMFLLVALALGLTGTRPLPQWLLSQLQAPFTELPTPVWAGSNAIILLGSGTVQIGDVTNPSVTGFGRIEKAVSAWRTCRAGGKICTIVTSGGDPLKKGVAEADVFEQTLISLGVPASDILRDAKSRNTFENAKFTRDLLAGSSVERIFLVTSGYHMQRSLMFFRHFGVDAQPLPALMLEADPAWQPQAGNISVTDAVLHEYAGMVQYHLYNMLGWNPPPVR
jgi:uncharacterized SAM-binding protein YcdF (DUF218 family)